MNNTPTEGIRLTPAQYKAMKEGRLVLTYTTATGNCRLSVGTLGDAADYGNAFTLPEGEIITIEATA